MVDATSSLLSGNTKHMAQAKIVHAALRAIGRNLLSVDDPAMDLPLRQLKVCMALLHSSCSMTEISQEVGLSRSSVTQVSDRLERRGLVERELQSDDRRVRKLKLTQKGLQLMRSHERKQLQRIAAVLKELSKSEIEDMLAGLAVLSRREGTLDATMRANRGNSA